VNEVRTVVLVEGISDKVAVEALAERRGRRLEVEGILVVPMGGASNIGRYLDRFGPRGLDADLAGLCDAAEARDFTRALEHARLGTGLDRDRLADLGFFVCVADLEDELIRALGTTAVEAVIEEQAELASLRNLQNQPAHRGRPLEQQLRRFIGTRSGRKAEYARLLIHALDLARVPAPLDRLVDYLGQPARFRAAASDRDRP
jgi:hypothetical protein